MTTAYRATPDRPKNIDDPDDPFGRPELPHALPGSRLAPERDGIVRQFEPGPPNIYVGLAEHQRTEHWARRALPVLLRARGIDVPTEADFDGPDLRATCGKCGRRGFELQG
jgi:hypothetical protein